MLIIPHHRVCLDQPNGHTAHKQTKRIMWTRTASICASQSAATAIPDASLISLKVRFFPSVSVISTILRLLPSVLCLPSFVIYSLSSVFHPSSSILHQSSSISVPHSMSSPPSSTYHLFSALLTFSAFCLLCCFLPPFTVQCLLSSVLHQLCPRFLFFVLHPLSILRLLLSFRLSCLLFTVLCP